jgi:hypothetical protein
MTWCSEELLKEEKHHNGVLTAEMQLALLRNRLATLDAQARELDAARAAIAAKITGLERKD